MSSERPPDAVERMLRLFVALELPASVRTAIDGRATAELGTSESLRSVSVDGLHVTLCFLGATAATEVEAIGACCRMACAGARPLRLTLGELVALPPRRPRVIAVRVGDEPHGRPTGGRGSTRLAELQNGVADALAEGGWYRPERRPFLAHVTVARVRAGARLDPRGLEERTIASRRKPPGAAAGGDASPIARLPATFTADVVTVFESRTQPGGAVYQPRARIELAA